MAESIDSSFHTQFGTMVEPGQDLELEHMNAFCSQVPDNTSIWTDNTYGGYSSYDTLSPQYSYPPPPVAYNYRPHPYPDPSVQTTEQIAACYAPNNVNPNTIRAQQNVPTDNPTIAPSQITLQRGQEPVLARPRTRDGRKAQHEGRKSTQPPVRSRRQITTPHQGSAHTQPPKKPQRAIRPAPNLFRDGSTPYVPGRTPRRESDLQYLTDAVEAVVERPSFACDECGRPCKNKSDLNHHKVIHDPNKMNRHKCQLCDAAFLYPKDLGRHIAAKHGQVQAVQHACADCDKVYKRKDHLDRHTKRKGHVAATGATALIPVSPMSPSPSTNTYDDSSILDALPHDGQIPDRSYGYAAQLHTFNQQSLSHLDPSLPQPSPFSLPSFTSGSIDDTFTVSEPNSFWSEEF